MQQILIIGTNINSGKTLKYSLQNDMIRAYYALSLEDAAKHLVRYTYHLIIMDIDEPVPELLQSLEVLRKIRLVPILVLSPASTSEYIENLLTVADDFLQKRRTISKPVTESDIILTLPNKICKKAARFATVLLFCIIGKFAIRRTLDEKGPQNAGKVNSR